MVTISLEHLCQIRGVSPLQKEDERIFREKVLVERPNSMDIKDSWAYVLQASRNLPYKIERKDSLFLLGAKDDQSALVIPNYFSNDETLRRVTEELAQRLEVPIILKNVDPKDVERLRALGCDNYRAGEEWTSECPYDDQTYPQRIIKLESLKRHAGKEYHRLRREIHRYLDVSPNASFKPYIPKTDREKIEEICKKKECLIPGFFDAHKVFLELQSNQRTTSLVIQNEGETVGFLLYDIISAQNCIAYNATIITPEIPFLPTAVLYREARRILDEKRFPFLNLQGSETDGLDRWKRSFAPYQSIEKTHMIYRK